jgi:hypothetical protein
VWKIQLERAFNWIKICTSRKSSLLERKISCAFASPYRRKFHGRNNRHLLRAILRKRMCGRSSFLVLRLRIPKLVVVMTIRVSRRWRLRETFSASVLEIVKEMDRR